MYATVEARQHPTYRYRTAYWATVADSQGRHVYQQGPYRKRKDAMKAAQKRIDDTRPGTEHDTAGMLRRKAAAPIKPNKPQAACDFGLFSDASQQIDLEDMLRTR